MILRTIKSIRRPSHVLPALLAILTKKKRYLPKIKFSKESWVHNVFAVWELIAGIPYGVFPDATTDLVFKHGVLVYKKVHPHTFRSKLAHVETFIREKVLGFNLSLTQRLSIQRGAIAFDAAVGNEAVTGTLTISHTATGTDLVAMVNVNSGNVVTNGGDSISALTYDTVSIFANLVTKVLVVANSYQYMFYKIAPPTGAKDVVATNDNASYTIMNINTYTGVHQTSAFVDSFNTGTVTAGTALAISTTVVKSNCWLVMGQRNNGGVAFTGDAGTTVRIQEPNGGGSFDSAATVSTGSQQLGTSWIGAFNCAGVIASITPPFTAGNHNSLLILGIG